MQSNLSPTMVTPELRPTTTLVIDDEELVRQSFGAILGVYGLNVLFAANGAMALEVFEKYLHDIDVVILDLTLPDMPGETVLKKIREVRPDVAFIIMSGHPESSFGGRFANLSKICFLPKPSPINELILKINQVLGKAG